MNSLTFKTRTSRVLSSFPPACQVVYASLSKQAHEQYPHSLHQKIIRTSTRIIAARTLLSQPTVSRAINYLHAHKVVGYVEAPGKRRHYIIRPVGHWKTPTKPSVIRAEPRKSPKPKTISTRLPRSSSQDHEKKGKPDKRRAERTVGTSPVPSIGPRPIPSSLSFLRSCGRRIQETALPEGRLWKASTQGVMFKNATVPHAEVDALMVKLVGMSREFSADPTLDEGILGRRANGSYHPARCHIVTMVALGVERLGSVKSAFADVCKQFKGNLHRQSGRKAAGKRVYPSVSNFASGVTDPTTKRRTMPDTSHADRNRSDAWRRDRDVNEEWQAHGRHEEEQRKQREREAAHQLAMKASDHAKSLTILERIKAMLAGDPAAKAACLAQEVPPCKPTCSSPSTASALEHPRSRPNSSSSSSAPTPTRPTSVPSWKPSPSSPPSCASSRPRSPTNSTGLKEILLRLAKNPRIWDRPR